MYCKYKATYIIGGCSITKILLFFWIQNKRESLRLNTPLIIKAVKLFSYSNALIMAGIFPNICPTKI